jgi:hypothetical protein
MIYWEDIVHKNITEEATASHQNEIFPEKRVKSRATEVYLDSDIALSHHARTFAYKSRHISSDTINLEQQSSISSLVDMICDNISDMILTISEECISISDLDIQNRS